MAVLCSAKAAKRSGLTQALGGMIRFVCQYCKSTIDSSRDHVWIPRVPGRDGKSHRAHSEYKCTSCGAYYRLTLRPMGLVSLPLLIPLALLALVTRSPEVAGKLAEWLGPYVVKAAVVAPPNNSFNPMPLRGTG